MTDAAEVKTESALLELAARCEAATGADINLDAAIRDALGLPNDYKADWRGWGFDAHGKPIEKPKAFPYTASLDAAMTLVPEGWNHGYRASAKYKNAQAWCEFIPEAPFAPDELMTRNSGKCSTPALALCAASLRARASLPPSTETRGEK